MTSLDLPSFVTTFLAVMAALLVFAVGLGLLLVAILYLIDITQTQHAVRRNFPVIVRLRYRMEHLGVFFRQYFYAMDREEMPFNRAQRTWVYRAAKNLENTQPFGSTRDLRPPGTLLFAHATFPALETMAEPAPWVVIGPDCVQPYAAGSFFNISAMS
jgi:type II secretory pathway component PulJ